MEQLIKLCKSLNVRLVEVDALPAEGCYVPNLDVIYLSRYYCRQTNTCPMNVLAHEIGHWTGRSNRLNRFDFSGRPENLDVEELTASYFGILLLEMYQISSQDNKDVLSRIDANEIQHKLAQKQAKEAMSYFETLMNEVKCA